MSQSCFQQKERDWLVHFSSNVEIENDVFSPLIVAEQKVIKINYPNANGLIHKLKKGVRQSSLILPERRIVRQLLEARLAVIEDNSNEACKSTTRQLAYLDSHTAYPQAAQRRLGQVTMALIGLGGIGSVLLQHLVSSGISEYILVDDDKVDMLNLNCQQIYHQEDVGRWKVKVAEEYVISRLPGSQVLTSNTRIESMRDLERVCNSELKPDILVLCADQPPGLIQEWALLAAWKTGTAILEGGVGIRWAQWGPLLNPTDPIDRSFFHRVLRQLRNQARLGLPVPIGSFGPTNTIVGSYMAKDLIAWAAGLKRYLSLRSMCTLDFDTGQTIFHGFES